MIEKFTNVGPTYFNFQSVQTACAIDTREAAPLINSHKGLKAAMGEIEKLEAMLKNAVNEALRKSNRHPTSRRRKHPSNLLARQGLA